MSITVVARNASTINAALVAAPMLTATDCGGADSSQKSSTLRSWCMTRKGTSVRAQV
jgi:hypothetical protein